MVGLTFATLLRAPPVAEERLTELLAELRAPPALERLTELLERLLPELERLTELPERLLLELERLTELPERLLLEHAFETLHMRAVLADATLKNARSQRVLEKLGFERVSRDETFVCYKINADQYRKTQEEERGCFRH